MAATAISAAIRPYSIAVAAFSLRQSWHNIFETDITTSDCAQVIDALNVDKIRRKSIRISPVKDLKMY
jgi:hypothetical protein